MLTGLPSTQTRHQELRSAHLEHREIVLLARLDVGLELVVHAVLAGDRDLVVEVDRVVRRERGEPDLEPLALPPGPCVDAADADPAGDVTVGDGRGAERRDRRADAVRRAVRLEACVRELARLRTPSNWTCCPAPVRRGTRRLRAMRESS